MQNTKKHTINKRNIFFEEWFIKGKNFRLVDVSALMSALI